MNKQETAIFAAGCFWSVQDAFDEAPGVISTRVGYTGGKTSNPTYKEVCTGDTDHAEAVEVTFDPKKGDYKQLLEAFWKMHDPTQLNRQGADIGTQYRSEIFYLNPEQKKIAEVSLKAHQNKINGNIMTKITPASHFFEAEEYHQHYHKKKI